MAVPMTAGLDRLADNLIAAASTQQAVQVRRAMLAACAPAPALIAAEARNTLPKSGHLNEWVATASTKVLSVGTATTGTVTIRSRKTGHNLKEINAGAVRHPTYGRRLGRGSWHSQSVKPGYFSRPVETVIVPAVSAALTAQMAETARRLTS